MGVKRLAASLAVAARDNGFPAKAGRKIALAAAERYRTAMREFAAQTFLDVWYAHLDIEPAIAEFRSQVNAKRYKEAEKLLAKAHTSDSMKALDKLTTIVDGQRRIISDPPMIVPVEDLFADVQAEAIYKLLGPCWASTGAPFSPTGGTCSSSSPWCRWPARSSGSAASAPAPRSC